MWGSGFEVWPVTMAPPNRLRAGQIVVDRDRPGELAVVTCDPGEGHGVMVASSDVVLVPLNDDGAPSSSVRTVTSNHDGRWVRAPEGSVTRVAKVVAAHYGWRPLSGRSAEDVAESGPADDDHEPWHLLAALLSDEDFDRVTGDDWPGCFELALAVAQGLDRAVGRP